MIYTISSFRILNGCIVYLLPVVQTRNPSTFSRFPALATCKGDIQDCASLRLSSRPLVFSCQYLQNTTDSRRQSGQQSPVSATLQTAFSGWMSPGLAVLEDQGWGQPRVMKETAASYQVVSPWP